MNARLHILNKAPDHGRYRRCLETLETGDVLVLMESGVLALATDPFFASRLEGIEVYAIRGDDMATYPHLPGTEPGVEVIDYPRFVDLICRLGSPVSW